MRLVVFGGGGFVGSAIAAKAAKQGLKVVSLTRRGTRPEHLGGSGCWSDQVEWAAADATDPSTYAALLQDASAVVVSVGSPPVPGDFSTAVRANGETNVAVAKAALLVPA